MLWPVTDTPKTAISRRNLLLGAGGAAAFAVAGGGVGYALNGDD
jgi:hypothetical protein